MIKITGGQYKGRNVDVPDQNMVRPTSSRGRELIFNLLAHNAQINNLDLSFPVENAVFWDIYSGSGIMGLEALSRGARQIVFIDQEKHFLKKIETNAAKWGAPTLLKTLAGDATKISGTGLPKASHVFMDPPYKKDLACLTLNNLAQNCLLEDRALCICETEKNADMSSVDQECYQLLFTKDYASSRLWFFAYTKPE